MIHVPRSLAALCPLASDNESRYAMNGVRLIQCKDGWWRAEVTDGKVAAVVQGPDLPPVPPASEASVRLAANGAAEAVLLAQGDAKRVGLADALKLPGQGGVTLTLGATAATALTADGSRTVCVVEGRWPPLMEVMPRGKRPLATFKVNARVLMKLLKAALPFTQDDAAAVTFVVFRPTEPVGLFTKNGRGETFDGIFMPLT